MLIPLLFPALPVGGRLAQGKKSWYELLQTTTFHDTKVTTGNFLQRLSHGLRKLRLCESRASLAATVNGRQMDLARTLQTNEGNMESVEVSHKQADWMLIVYFALSPSNSEEGLIQLFCSEYCSLTFRGCEKEGRGFMLDNTLKCLASPLTSLEIFQDIKR